MILTDVSTLSKKSRKRVYNKWYYQKKTSKKKTKICLLMKRKENHTNQSNEEMTKVDNKVNLHKQNKKNRNQRYY